MSTHFDKIEAGTHIRSRTTGKEYVVLCPFVNINHLVLTTPAYDERPVSHHFADQFDEKFEIILRR